MTNNKSKDPVIPDAVSKLSDKAKSKIKNQSLSFASYLIESLGIIRTTIAFFSLLTIHGLAFSFKLPHSLFPLVDATLISNVVFTFISIAMLAIVLGKFLTFLVEVILKFSFTIIFVVFNRRKLEKRYGYKINEERNERLVEASENYLDKLFNKFALVLKIVEFSLILFLFIEGYLGSTFVESIISTLTAIAVLFMAIFFSNLLMFRHDFKLMITNVTYLKQMYPIIYIVILIICFQAGGERFEYMKEQPELTKLYPGQSEPVKVNYIGSTATGSFFYLPQKRDYYFISHEGTYTLSPD